MKAAKPWGEVLRRQPAASAGENWSYCLGKGIDLTQERVERTSWQQRSRDFDHAVWAPIWAIKFHSFNLSLTPVIPQGNSKHSSAAAQWKRARRQFYHLRAEQRQRNFILLHHPLSSTAPSVPQLPHVLAGSSWETQLVVGCRDMHSASHRYKMMGFLVISMSLKIPSPSQADLPGIILNHFKNGECKNPGHKILISTLRSREQKQLPTPWKRGTNNKHLHKRWSLSKQTDAHFHLLLHCRTQPKIYFQTQIVHY